MKMSALLNKKRGLSIWALLSAQVALGASQVNSIEFKVENGQSVIEIKSTEPLKYTEEKNSQDNQLILDLSETTLSASAKRKLDTSSFNSPVTLVSPYQLKDPANQSRIVVQFRGAADYQITPNGNTLRVTVPEAGGTLTADAPTESSASSADAPPSDNITDNAVPAPESGGSLADSIAVGDRKKSTSSTESAATSSVPKDRLQSFLDNKDKRTFSGSPITLQVKDADITDIMRLIGEASGFNIILGPDVHGKITLSLVNVPWDQVLDVVLHTLGLGAERNGNILRVLTLGSLTREKQAEAEAKRAAQSTAPRVTRIFPINYADPKELQNMISSYARSGGSAADSSAVVSIDDRTNSLIIQDLPENIERAAKLIELLDTQTPQVLIEAKIVEASESFTKSVGGSFGVGGSSTSNNQFVTSFAGGNPTDRLIGSPGVFSSGSAISAASNRSGVLGISPTLSILPGIRRLNALISIGESEQQVKVVSSPKTVVLNKNNATIVQSTPVVLSSAVNAGGVVTINKQVLQGNISLNVSPTVTNDENVLMSLAISRDVPTDLGEDKVIANRNMNTKVLVESGSTLVIGGIYTMDQSQSSNGFPILRKIPILGVLFGNESANTSRSELFIFVTPKILNVRRAGLAT